MRTQHSSAPIVLATGLMVAGLLASCGRPAPEGTEVGAAPDPAAQAATESTDATANSTSNSTVGDANDAATDESIMSETGTGAVNEAGAEVDAGAMADGQGTTTDEQAQAQTQTAAPAAVVITADNLSGIIDDSINLAGVRVTSSNPIVAVTPVVETTPSTVGTQPGGMHVVQPGDTLSVIAETYGVPMSAIADANGLDDVNAIKPGQELIIPAG